MAISVNIMAIQEKNLIAIIILTTLMTMQQYENSCECSLQIHQSTRTQNDFYINEISQGRMDKMKIPKDQTLVVRLPSITLLKYNSYKDVSVLHFYMPPDTRRAMFTFKAIDESKSAFQRKCKPRDVSLHLKASSYPVISPENITFPRNFLCADQSLKKTNISQFQKLVELMEEHPQLGTGSPTFGSTRVMVDEKWDNVAKKINAFGPPVRSGSEWKRVWHDQKCRVKKKISENNKSLHGTGGGPCAINNLTQLELHIDRICHLSSAAAPAGTTLGLPCALKLVEITPPRRCAKIAVVTPTSSKQLDGNTKSQMEDSSEVFRENAPAVFEEHSYTSPIINTSQSLPLTLRKIIPTLTPKKQPLPNNRKRKYNERTSERIQLLIQQNEMQNKTLDIMNKHAEAAKIQAEAARVHVEVTKDQGKALKEIAESTKDIKKSLIDLIKYLQDED